MQAIDAGNHISKNKEYDQEIVFLMNRLSFNYEALRNMKETVDMYLRAYQLSRETYGEKNLTTISLMQNLAKIYKLFGKKSRSFVYTE